MVMESLSAQRKPNNSNRPLHLDLENLEKVLLGLEKERSSNGLLHLDFDAMRCEAAAAGILSAALVGTLGDRPAQVKLPENAHCFKTIAESGLAFALANRSGATVTEPQIDRLLGSWKLPWTPGSSQQLNLFSKEPSGVEPTTFGPRHAAFVNPHHACSLKGRSEISSIVPAWLGSAIGCAFEDEKNKSVRRLPRFLKPSPSNPRDTPLQDFVLDIGSILQELVENITEHGTIPGRQGELRSLILISLNCKEDDGVVQLTVIDNGIGILGTIRPKLNSETRDLRDTALIGRLFQGKLCPSARARGMGLPRVWRIIQRWEGYVSLWTSTCRVFSSKGKNGPADGQATTFSMAGTVLTLSLPVKKVR